jgi:uncharacterized membrane-anchored protein
MTTLTAAPSSPHTLLNRVPEITIYFWVIKVLATTVGETAADLTSSHFGFSLGVTTLIMSAILAPALVYQFSLRRYLPGPYWLAVVLISIVGTLITDNLSDGYGVSLWVTTGLFSVALVVSFAAWFARERTLSIHKVWTTRREAFYWLAVLFTFALGTAGGDLVAEQIGLGYWKSAMLFAGMIGLVYLAHRVLGLHAIPSFWVAYVLTRPLGASIGDFLSQPRAAGGLALGTVATSAIFLTAILAVVAHLSITKLDRSAAADPADLTKHCPACEQPLPVSERGCGICGWAGLESQSVAA